MAKRLTARQRALPGLTAEANKRLQAIAECPEGDWRSIEDACSQLAQLGGGLEPDCLPDWEACPLGTLRYQRIGMRHAPKR